jgi:membrane fusion protein, multidrug efflux system
MTAVSTNSAAPAAPNKRRMLMLAGPMVLLVAGGAYWLSGGRYVTTENAYLHQARISVAAQVGGRVAAVDVADNQTVKAGDALFAVDATPYELALAQAETAVASARLGVEQLRSGLAQAKAQLKLAEEESAYQVAERIRQEELEQKGVSTDSKLADARHTERRALDQRDLARQSVAMALAALGGDEALETDTHPAVQAALVARDQAAYNLGNVAVTAPADGVIYQASSFKPGQMVAPGVSLFALVQTADVWVDANFKETELAGIAVGQTAELAFDLDRSHKIDAVVEAIGAGTGSEFSLLPAQNATGNWVKVTQRIPVRLRLVNPADAVGLSSGMSAEVSVDTGQSRSLSDLLPAFLTGR